MGHRGPCSLRPEVIIPAPLRGSLSAPWCGRGAQFRKVQPALVWRCSHVGPGPGLGSSRSSLSLLQEGDTWRLLMPQHFLSHPQTPGTVAGHGVSKPSEAALAPRSPSVRAVQKPENTRLRRVACPSGSQLPSQVAVESACVSSGARVWGRAREGLLAAHRCPAQLPLQPRSTGPSGPASGNPGVRAARRSPV